VYVRIAISGDASPQDSLRAVVVAPSSISNSSSAPNLSK
jgi:hypothetical protein